MRALVKTASGPGNLELLDVPVPQIGDDDVLVAITHCGICGSDLHIETAVHPCRPPVVPGHEYTGVVAKLGANVSQFDEGDLVSYLTGWAPFPGVGSDGGFQEFMRAPAKSLWRTPEGVTPEEASQFEAVIVPMGLVRDHVKVQPGERVVITGPGQIGLLTANVAKLEGAGHVTVLGAPGDEKVRLPKALEMGADAVGMFGEEELAKLVGENAPTCWFETSGAPAAAEAAVDHVQRGGRICLSGLGEGRANLDTPRISYNNIKLLGVWGGNESYIPESAQLMRDGKLKVSATITATMPLTEWREAFAKLRAKQAIKILLDPSR